MGRADPLSRNREELGPELSETVLAAIESPAARDAPIRRDGQPAASAAASRPGRMLAPRLVVVLALIVAGIVWAVIRGLHFYGLAPLHLAYDLDQPPVLIILVGGWLAYRSSRR